MRTRERLEQEFENIRCQLIDGASVSELARRYSCGAGTMFTFLEQKGENVRRGDCCSSTALSDSKPIIDLHLQGCTSPEIGKIMGYDTQVVRSLLKRMGLNNDPKTHSSGFRYDINHEVFTSIDDEVSAYSLGLLAADGCLTQTVTGSKMIAIQLNEKDAYILKPLRDRVCPDIPLRLYRGQKRLIWCSSQASEDLKGHGLTPRKSLTMGTIVSRIPKDLQHHCIRGYFDGDGWITSRIWKGKKKVEIGMIGTHEFLSDVHDCIGIPVSKARADKTNLLVHRLVYQGKGRMYELKEYMYKDATLYLQRKYDRFIW